MMKTFLLRSFFMLLVLAYFVGPRVWGESAKDASVLDSLKFVQGDEDGNDKKAVKAEMLVSQTEAKAVAQIQKLIKKYKGTQLEPDLQFRLAEMYMRKSKTDRFFELHRESQTNVSISPRLATKSASKASLTQAVDVYQMLQKRFPTYSQMDLVIFNHAFARQALGQEKEAEGLYQALINRFKDSPMVPDAYLAVGEIAFQKAQFPRALENFDAIRKFPEARVYPYGLYKAGWTHYNMRKADLALKSLEEVVAYGDKVAKEHLDAKLDLRKEALVDMTLFYEDVMPSKNAYSYFMKQAGEKELPGLLMKLSDLYQRHARYNDEREVLAKLVYEQPASNLVPDAHTKLVAAADSLKDKPQAIKDLGNFFAACEPRGAFGKVHPEQLAECTENLRKSSLTLAERWLKIWKKNNYDETYADSSEAAFAIYLRVDQKKDQDYYQSRYLFAELLFQRKKYRRASEEYAAVGMAVHDKTGHEAAYAACVSLENAVGDKWSADDEKTFNKLAQNYVKNHPQGQYRLEIEFKMGFLAYEKGRYDEAAPIFLRLGQQYPKDEKGQKSQDLYLDILNLQKDYHGLRSVAKDLIKKGAPPERLAKLKKVYEQAYFMEIQKLEEKGDLKTALNEYGTFAKENSQSDLAEKAQWNMIQLSFKTGDNFAGAQASLEFAKRYPKSEQGTQALGKAAQMFEAMAQLAPAADVLVQLANRDTANHAKWLELAADFYALSGRSSQARKYYQELLPLMKEESRLRLYGKMETFENNYGSAASKAEFQKQMISKDIPPMANEVKVAKAEKTYKESYAADAFAEAKRVISNNSMTPAQKARARLIQGQVLQAEFEAQSVKAKPDRIAMVLAIKTEKLAKAEEAYQSTIRYSDPETSLAAQSRLYDCFHDYVTALRGIQAPADMTPAESKAFLNELNNLMIPLEEKSVDILAQALAFARKHPTFDKEVGRLETQLAEVNHRPQIISHTDVKMPPMVAPVREWSSL
jgi:cellulose synthase operon protein C